MVTKKNLTLLLFLLTFFFGCNDDVHVLKENEEMNTLEDHINPQDVKRKNYSSARVNVSGGSLTFIVDSPVDNAGNVIVRPSGTTQINFRVIIARNSTTSNVHLQFQIRNSIQSVFWTSAVIRTLDFSNNQLEKTITGSFNVRATGINYGLCLFIRDFIGAQDSTGDCKTMILGIPDLIIANRSVSNASVARGQLVTVSATAKNQGTDLIYGTFIGYYLSTDATFGNDVYIGDNEIATLNPGESITKSEQVLIPSSISPGNYYILFFVDYQYQVSESSENNNFAAIPISIL